MTTRKLLKKRVIAAVSCPWCGAKAGKKCRKVTIVGVGKVKGRHVLQNAVHTARIDRYQKLMKKWGAESWWYKGLR